MQSGRSVSFYKSGRVTFPDGRESTRAAFRVDYSAYNGLGPGDCRRSAESVHRSSNGLPSTAVEYSTVPPRTVNHRLFKTGHRSYLAKPSLFHSLVTPVSSQVNKRSCR